jgi:zinc/manganese transport system substrate-binding protein
MARRATLACALALTPGVVAAGCGAADTGGPQGSAAIAAVATTTQVGDLVRQVGGPRVTVDQILRPNSDPHAYEPRPSDARQIEGARVVFRSGGDVDEWMKGLIESNGGDVHTVDLIDTVPLRRRGGEVDPHWWQNPRNAERAVGAIRSALSRADPPGRAAYARRAAAYTTRLRRLDHSVAACIGRVPLSRRTLVTSHDALGYYADRYGLRLVGAVIPSLSSQAQPSARDIAALVDQIRREGARAIFPERSLNPKLEAAVSRESGARVGGGLWADALGPGGSDGATYVGSIASNTRTIARDVTGGRVRCRVAG